MENKTTELPKKPLGLFEFMKADFKKFSVLLNVVLPVFYGLVWALIIFVTKADDMPSQSKYYMNYVNYIKSIFVDTDTLILYVSWAVPIFLIREFLKPITRYVIEWPVQYLLVKHRNKELRFQFDEKSNYGDRDGKYPLHRFTANFFERITPIILAVLQLKPLLLIYEMVMNIPYLLLMTVAFLMGLIGIKVPTFYNPLEFEFSTNHPRYDYLTVQDHNTPISLRNINNPSNAAYEILNDDYKGH
ncbi:hypothetical protein GCM10008107_06950 [Psychrosphaera saromensis]|uniref:Uncharacterized protein n=1 Tax=Psychrosphaera saromensis TaxID=716813 RepID=A0A2S7UWS7_9GAMM|nr:hypothetical protein [Psychrosphaera saromensis]PQJ54397.1 hypothetical protein BTO11_12495 [Psychrosphaera saromensis]GHB60320.1 hypothetical protein GCM10008107_06950 [Psychrosphaera saromensis]GLQ14607.1 hypothetical protein GCM10007917_20620 [Psychrosphaera saromensis]